MKKSVIAGLIVVLAAVGFFVVMGKDSKDNNEATSPTKTESNRAKGKTACELLTLEDAKSLLGGNAVLVEGSGSPNLATTESIDVDNCTYSSDGETLGDLKQITIQGHYGDKGGVVQAYESNRKAFPGEDISGLADKAYYATEAKHVHAVKGDYWIFVFGGSINAGDTANKELGLKATQLALEKI